jgi:signal transduction histidine kinase
MSQSPVPSSDPQLLQRQYDEIAALAGGLAHEVRNPLSTIRLNLELLFEELEAIEHPGVHRMLRKLKTIQNECGRLEEILEAFLQFARAGELELEETDLAEVLRSFLEFYKPEAEQHRIDIRPHVAADLPVIKADQQLIRQVLANLVRNAQQAMPDGGLIEIQAFPLDGEVVLEMIDTGVGIPPAAAGKIFDAFFSTKAAGSGLGLPTVRKIMEAHGGTIHCESEPGKGTRFTLRFPAAKE